MISASSRSFAPHGGGRLPLEHRSRSAGERRPAAAGMSGFASLHVLVGGRDCRLRRTRSSKSSAGNQIWTRWRLLESSYVSAAGNAAGERSHLGILSRPSCGLLEDELAQDELVDHRRGPGPGAGCWRACGGKRLWSAAIKRRPRELSAPPTVTMRRVLGPRGAGRRRGRKSAAAPDCCNLLVRFPGGACSSVRCAGVLGERRRARSARWPNERRREAHSS